MAIDPGTRLGPYEVLAPLGAGGMGEVYRARDTRLGRTVAIKVLPASVHRDENRLRRFEQEARAAGVLNHPNLLAVFDVGEHDGAPYLVTEFLEGQTLRERLARPVDLADALDYVAQIASGLAAAHEKGIVHRDVKPENVFLRSDGFVKVLDFGLAKLAELPSDPGDSGDVTLVKVDTDPGAVLGTVKYMSPEQVRGLEVDARTDIFSLGGVLYEMVAGNAPFAAPTSGDVIVSILERDPWPLSSMRADVPDVLDAICNRALSKDRATRYQTVEEFAADVRDLRRRLDADAPFDRLGRSGSNAGTIAGVTAARAAQRRTRKPIDSLAVLPFDNASADPGAEYLSDGISESIINGLAQIPKLRVVSRTTVFRYKGRRVDPLVAGRELGVRAVLAGRVLPVGDDLVIRTELVDVANDAQVWGGQYRRKASDILAVEEEISREICDQLRLKLSGEERRRLTKRYTENTEAYHLYLRGRYCVNKRTHDWLRKGIGYFQQAIDLDPNYALAYAGMADAYGLLGSSTGGLPPTDTYPKAKAAAERALEIDESLGEAHTALGFFRLLYDWDWPAAEACFKRAIELNPNYASAHDGYGFYCKVMGRHQEAIAACTRALELDPLSLFITTSVGWAHYFARDFDRAIEFGRKTLEMDPDFGVAYWNIGLAYEALGRYEDEIDAFSRAARTGRGITFMAHIGRARALAGRSVEAQMVLDDMREQSARRYVPAYYFAIVHLGLGERDRAFEYLERAYEERSGFLAFLGVEPMFDVVRGDARFEDLTRRVGIATSGERAART
jgi:serine/threonine protein kinase/tetratricopeptide (TPR) repeat protein